MFRIASSRLLPRISAFSFSTTYPAAPAASSSPTAAAAAAAASDASSSAGDPSSPPPPATRRPWTALKFGAIAAVSAALGTTGYVSYGAVADPSFAWILAVIYIGFAIQLPFRFNTGPILVYVPCLIPFLFFFSVCSLFPGGSGSDDAGASEELEASHPCGRIGL
jgi:hypothetical protein